MKELGFTRSAHLRDHLLQTPDTFVRAPLPGMTNATAIVHIGPSGGAAFTQYTAEFAAGGSLGPAKTQRFVYVLEGEISAGVVPLRTGGFAYFSGDALVIARTEARAAVIEKGYVPLAGQAAPAGFTGHEDNVQPEALLGDSDVLVRSLIPSGAEFDLAVNVMEFQPGASLPMVEQHVMEHGLLMLQGGGIYRLGDQWYPVTAGDFIWMGPFCPQWFAAVGRQPARYLIYKDWNRHPL